MSNKKSSHKGKRSNAQREAAPEPSTGVFSEVLDDGSISIDVEAPKVRQAKIGGIVYEVKPIKAAFGMRMIQGFGAVNNEKDMARFEKRLNELIRAMFYPEEAKKISSRLKDGEDGLDYPHIIELAKILMEDVGGNPTT